MPEGGVDIVGLGLATMDILTVVPHLPRPDDVYEAAEVMLQGGGMVATALVAATRLGASTSYVGPVGGGPWGAAARSEFVQYGVDLSWAVTREEGDQALSVILVDEGSGRRSILYNKGGMAELSTGEVPVSLIQSARALHLDGTNLDAAVRAARVARERGVVVCFDGGAGAKWSGVEQLLPLVDLLIVARRFAQHETGEADPARAAGALLAAYQPRQVVITDGDQGCWFRDGETQLRQPAFDVEVVDTTGAGDVFHGAYLYAYLQSWQPAYCLAFASASAALKCRRLGGRAGIPQRSQVDAFLQARGFEAE